MVSGVAVGSGEACCRAFPAPRALAACRSAFATARPGKLRSSRQQRVTGGRSVDASRVFALDAAQGFDYESRQAAARENEKAAAAAAAAAAGPKKAKKKLKIGIVGFGTFGQFLTRRFVAKGHEVLATSRADYHDLAASLGARYFTDGDDFCEQHPDVVVLCTSIISTERVLRALPITRLRRSTLFVDMLSVKQFPKQLMLAALPAAFDVLCCHPMFGPQSGRGAWDGLPLVYERVRVGAEGARADRAAAFLDIFASEGCRMVEMACEEHDRLAAGSQFITHTVGRVLGRMQLTGTPINTKGFDSLLSLVDNTNSDSFELYYGLFMYNRNATDTLAAFERALDEVKNQLFDQLHDTLRQQLFEPAVGATRAGGARVTKTVPGVPGLPPPPTAVAVAAAATTAPAPVTPAPVHGVGAGAIESLETPRVH